MGFAFGGGKLSTTEECSPRARGVCPSSTSGKIFPEVQLARVGFARRGGNVSTSGFSVQLALMGFARYLRELRKHFLNSRVQLARVWGLPVQAICP